MKAKGTVTDLPPGTELHKRYILGDAISCGGMGEVYRALDSQGESEVAVKRLLDLRHEARFTIEARLLSQLRHRRVVRVVDHFNDDTGMYLVMELVGGKDLGRILAESGDPGLPVDEAVGYVMQACEALRYVHEQQIVHRDVKPANLILSERGVVLVDFGIARELDPEASGTIGVGTPRFMAPEVLGGGVVAPRSDVFGLAATLWMLITGKAPMYGERVELRRRHPDMSRDLENALRGGLELLAEERIASVDAFATAVGGSLGRTGGTSFSLSVAGPARSRSMLEEVVRTAAGVFEAASASVALSDVETGELVYQAAWGTGADQIVGVRLPEGDGIAGAVVSRAQSMAIPDCRKDPRFAVQVATGTGFVPYTMLVVPMQAGGRVVGALSLLDRRDGGSYGPDDVVRAELFADLAMAALGETGDPLNRPALRTPGQSPTGSQVTVTRPST